MSTCAKFCSRFKISMNFQLFGGRNVHCLQVFDKLLSITSPLKFALAKKFGAKFFFLGGGLAPFFKQTMRDRILHSSFVISF